MAYTVKSGARMNPHLSQAAEKIAALLPFDIVITSGVRDAREQAQAMFTKIIGGDNLIAVYADDSFAQGVMDAYPDLDEATQFVQSYFDVGKGSNHGRGDALDVRTTGGSSGQLNETQIAELIDATNSLGYWSLREYVPPHLHVRVPRVESTLKKNIPFLAMVLGGIWILTK